MAFNGSGTFVLVAGNPVVSGQTISATTQNNTNNDIANGLTNCITKDGQSTPTANLPMGSKKLTGLAAGTNAGDSARYDELQLKADLASPTFTGTVTLPTTTIAPGLITLGDGASAIQLQSQTGYDAGGTSTAYTLTPNSPLATFTASIDVSGNMTVTSVEMGTIVIGMRITGTGISPGSYVTGGSGLSWTTNVTVVVASTSITGTAGLIPKERFRIKFNVSSGVAPTLALNGLTAKSLKQYNASGVKVPAIVYAGQLADVEYDGTDYVVLDAIQPLGQLSPLGVTQSAGQMVITLNPTTLDFRNSSVDVSTANTVTTLSVPTAITLTIPATATLGTANAVASKLLVLAINNGGTVELAVCNAWNSTNLNESSTITTTTISTGSTSAVTNYSTTGRTGVYFRVIGELASTQAIAGTWASLPTIKSGGAWTPLVNQPTLVTAQSALSGTSKDFIGIPSWAKRITMILTGISTNGTSDIIIRIGPTTVPEASGYVGSAIQMSSGANIVGSNTTDNGFCIASSVSNTTVFHGVATISLVTGSTWVSSSNLARSDVNASITGAGSKTITGTLGVVSLTTVGLDNFDGGTVNIMYE